MIGFIQVLIGSCLIDSNWPYWEGIESLRAA